MTKKLAKEIITEVLLKGDKIASVKIFNDNSAGAIVVNGVAVYYYYVDIKARYLSRQFLTISKVLDIYDWTDMIHWDRYTNK